MTRHFKVWKDTSKKHGDVGRHQQLGPSHYPLPTYTTPTQTQTHTPPVPHRIGKSQLSHPLTPSPPMPPQAKHILHQLLSSHAPHTSIAHALHSPQPHPHTIAPSHSLSMQHKQPYTHNSHSTHLIHIGYHDKLTDRLKTTTDTTQGHRHSSKSERNLITLQVNINGSKAILEELKLLMHDTHAAGCPAILLFLCHPIFPTFSSKSLLFYLVCHVLFQNFVNYC